MEMQFKQNSEVLTAHGQSVGRIERVVIDPLTKEVTDLIVRKGFLLTEDKVISISAIAGTMNDVVLLNDEVDLNTLRPFEEKQYVPIHEDEVERLDPQWGLIPSFYWVPPVYSRSASGKGKSYTIETEQNIPEGTVAVKEGAKVISADDRHVGNVERVITRPRDHHATHLLITRGLLLKERKVVPMNWVSLLGEEDVHLRVGASVIDTLRPYDN
jgi:uncharacterized protein YrrD